MQALRPHAGKSPPPNDHITYGAPLKSRPLIAEQIRLKRSEPNLQAAVHRAPSLPQLVGLIGALNGALDGSHLAAMHTIVEPLHDAMQTHIETLHTGAVHPPAHSHTLGEASVVKAPALADAPIPHGLSRSGLFDVDESIRGDVEKAERYLTKSRHVRGFFKHLRSLKTPIRIQYVKDSNLQYGVGKNTVIEWDNRTYLESHDLENLLADKHCGINSSAMILLHELHHADWAISNPIGQHVLFHMPHPLYDNLEEARVVQVTNAEARQLRESIRGSHRGRMYVANGLFDRNDGVCNIKGRLPGKSDFRRLYGTDDVEAFVKNAVNPESRNRIQVTLEENTSKINTSLMQKLHKLLDRHDDLGKGLVNATDIPEIPLPAALHDMYAMHIDDAVNTAAELRGIG